MESYLSFPDQHVRAARTPELQGGPWIDHPTERAREIQNLLDETRKKRSAQIAVAEAIKTLDDLLRVEGTGVTMESLYSKVPSVLRGYVELVYDLNHHAGIRFFENMMYRAPELFDRNAQAFAFRTIEKDINPFELTTPILESDPDLVFASPFDDPRVDEFFRIGATGAPLGTFNELLGLDGKSDKQLRHYFSPEPPTTRHARPETGTRVRYLGHACILLEKKHASILVDPFFSYEYPTQLPRYTIADLPETIDYVLITHSHEDHISLEHLLRLRHRIRTVIVPHTSGRSLQDPSMKLLLEALGFKSVREMRELERFEFEGGAITAIPFLGEHSELDIQCKSGYLIESLGTSVACVADSCNFDNAIYVHLAELLGCVDVLFLGMECEGAPLSRHYGMLHTQRIDRKFDSRRDKASNFQQAAALIEAWTPSHAYVYGMGLEPWLNHVLPLQGETLSSRQAKEFVAHCTDRRIRSEVLYGQKELVFP